ncbi:ABC transporter permease [Lacticaseibacillus mingshuiensis]|uniref:FtsX-like permease family protein n=1 Tax=Lacticaseibacillus mingshuiensis TaxID=2799574 RepID=A0ABW4CGP3_9LACO|nr:ABC transporter permease [Lacticaseibacillus mingshuiensis]
MNFVKRAWLNLWARKGRSALLILVTAAIMLFVLAGLLLRSAANTAVANAKSSVGATLTLSANREAAFKKMREQMEDQSQDSDSDSKTTPTRPSLTMTPVKLSDAEKIAKLSGIESYNVSVSTSANASGFDAIETSTGTSIMQGGGGFGGKGGFEDNSGDITISGVSSTAGATAFSDGTNTITKGRGLTSDDIGTINVVVETELAKQNDLAVGDTIKLKSLKTDDAAAKSYTVTIVGIYKAKSSSTAQMGPGASDPANTIFTSYSFANTLKGSDAKNTADSVIFTVSTPSKVDSVQKAAKKLINTSKFSIDSNDASYQMVKASMSSVTSFADKIVWLVAIAGTIILALIVILMIRERRFEIGVLLALGERRGKIIAQFFCELLVVLLVAIGLSSAGGQFVGDKLGEQVVASAQTSTTSNSQGGFTRGGGQAPSGEQGQGAPSGQMPGNMGGRTSSQAAMQKQAKLSTRITLKDVGLLTVFGLAIILIAITAGAAGILRLQPKKVLIGS